MDASTIAAAQALAAGDVLGALRWVSLREDAPALALRGIAMARLGELDRARILLKRAARAFGQDEAVAQSRCVIAEAEIALVCRDLGWPQKRLQAAREALEKHGDVLNAAHARHLQVRRLLLIGHLDEAERVLSGVDRARLSPALTATHELVVAGIAMRRLHAAKAAAALALAGKSARACGIAELMAEVDAALRALAGPVARLLTSAGMRPIRLSKVEAVLSSGALVIDACRGLVQCGAVIVPLARRPVLFALVQALGEAWPREVSRNELVRRIFRGKGADEAHRARLRVEIGRLRTELRYLANLTATRAGFVLTPYETDQVCILTPLVAERHAHLMALLADGESWSTSALAIALGTSSRTVQRALDALRAAGKASSVGRGSACRWTIRPAVDVPTILLLPGLRLSS